MKTGRAIVSVGVDYGGTWTRIAAINRRRKRVRFFKSPSQPIETLPFLLKKTFKQWNVKNLNSLVIGAKGVWKRKPNKDLLRKLQKFPLAKNVCVISDIKLAYEAALGDRAGVAIIAGTGSVAYGKARKNNGYFPILWDDWDDLFLVFKNLDRFAADPFSQDWAFFFRRRLTSFKSLFSLRF